MVSCGLGNKTPPQLARAVQHAVTGGTPPWRGQILDRKRRGVKFKALINAQTPDPCRPCPEVPLCKARLIQTCDLSWDHLHPSAHVRKPQQQRS